MSPLFWRILPKISEKARAESEERVIAVTITPNPNVFLTPIAKEAPKTEEIRAWLSLDGIANAHAPIPNIITVISVAHTP